MVILKFLLKIIIIGAAVLLSSYSIAEENIKEVEFGKTSLQSSSENLNFVLRKKCSEASHKRENKKYQNPYYFLRSSSFDIEEGSGVILVEHPVNIQGIRTIVQALEYPYDFDRPRASVSFEMPEGYKKGLASAIAIPFRTPPSNEKIKGNVKFSIVAEIRHLDGSSSRVNLGKKIKKHIKTSQASSTDESKGKPYIIRFRTSGVFSKGDQVTLVLKRINSNNNNFESAVYVPSLVFAYNVE